MSYLEAFHVGALQDLKKRNSATIAGDRFGLAYVAVAFLALYEVPEDDRWLSQFGLAVFSGSCVPVFRGWKIRPTTWK